MLDSGKSATRDKERTRNALIEAGIQLISERGTSVSLADVATRAGVSKGALTHHFASRDALVDAIVSDATQRFWDEVHSNVDISENRAGKLLRGYIRTLASESVFMRQFFSPTFLMLVSGSEQSIQNILNDDAEAWRVAFASDGIDIATSLVLRLAAEGLATSIDSPFLTASELESVRDRLLAMAEPAAS